MTMKSDEVSARKAALAYRKLVRRMAKDAVDTLVEVFGDSEYRGYDEQTFTVRQIRALLRNCDIRPTMMPVVQDELERDIKRSPYWRLGELRQLRKVFPHLHVEI